MLKDQVVNVADHPVHVPKPSIRVRMLKVDGGVIVVKSAIVPKPSIRVRMLKEREEERQTWPEACSKTIDPS